MGRTHIVKIRLTPVEKRTISDLAASSGQASIAAYLRARALQRLRLSEKERLVRELVRVNNLLNHVSKKSVGDAKIDHTLLRHAIDRNLEIVDLLRSAYRQIKDSRGDRDQD